MKRPVAFAALVYALLALTFVSPALVPGKVLSNSDSFWFQPPWVDVKPDGYERPANPEIDDIPSQMHSFLQYTDERLPDIPLWNPHITSGRPFLANAQSAVFSPYSLPSYAIPFHDSLALVAALKLFLAAFGTFLLARRLAQATRAPCSPASSTGSACGSSRGSPTRTRASGPSSRGSSS